MFGTLATFGPTLFSRFRLGPGIDGDGRLVLYLLEHSYLWVRRVPGHTRLWEAPFFFPERNVIAYSELMVGVAPPYWILRAVGAGPHVAFAGWLIIGCLTNYVIAYLLLRRLARTDAAASALGAFLFAFANPRIAQISHPQLVPQFLPLVTLLGLVCAVRAHAEGGTRGRVGGCLLLACLAEVVQLHGSYHHAWFVVFALATCLALVALSSTYRPFLVSFLRRHALAVVGCAILGLGLSLPLIHHYVAASRVVGLRSYSEMLTYAPQPGSWLFLGRENVLYASLLGPPREPFTPAEFEKQLGVGLVTTILAAFGLWAERRRPLFDILMAVAVLSVIVATMWLPPLSLWIPVFAVFPGARAIRAPGRIVLLLLVAVGFGAAVGVARLRARRWLAVLVFVVVIVEQLRRVPTYDVDEVGRRELGLAARVGPGCTAFYAIRPDSTVSLYQWQLDAMGASLISGVPTVNGLSGHLPRSLVPLRGITADSPAARDTVSVIMGRWAAQHGQSPTGICLI